MNKTTTPHLLRNLLLVLAVIVLIFAGIRVTGAAAQSSIPGDALYPVKTTIEQTRLSMASDAGARAQMKMTFAEQRLNEISALINEGRYTEIDQAVLRFEAGINGAILELETLSRVDPARSARLALEITSALTRYAQNLSTLAASAPEAVRGEVNRALNSTHTASGLDLPIGNTNGNDNSSGDDDDNGNTNGNTNGDDSANQNSNSNDNDDNVNGGNSNANVNGSDDDSNNNGSDDDDNANTNGNTNGDDDSSNTNNSVDDNASNDNGDDSGNSNDNGDDDDDDSNGNDDDGGNSGKGGDDDY